MARHIFAILEDVTANLAELKAVLAPMTLLGGRVADQPQERASAPRRMKAAASRSREAELALKESDDLKEIVSKVERQVIERVMRKVGGNQTLGARVLNMSRGSLIAKMKEFDIRDFRYRYLKRKQLYGSAVRPLTRAQRARVKKIRAVRGIPAAIALARKLNR